MPHDMHTRAREAWWRYHRARRARARIATRPKKSRIQLPPHTTCNSCALQSLHPIDPFGTTRSSRLRAMRPTMGTRFLCDALRETTLRTFDGDGCGDFEQTSYKL